MIISHRHEFIFVATPKTGTHAVRQALREQLGPKDQEQVGLFVRKEFAFPELARIGHGHLSLTQIRPFFGADVLDRYFKFAFVRNPFDRFVSYCAFMTRRERAFEIDPQGVMRHVLFKLRPVQHVHFQPQYTLLTGEDGQLATDMLGRFETMQASYDEICARIGIPSRPLDRVNDSRRGDYRAYYDQPLIDEVAAIYRRDLELFDYSF